MSKSDDFSTAETGCSPASGEASIAILGGSSAFAPALAGAFSDAARDLPPLEVRLHGRNKRKLVAVTRFCNRMARRRSVPHEYSYTTSVSEAAKGARIIINQMRIGGWAGRNHDDVFPLDFELPGDETIGPGGLASAVRGVPKVLEAAREAAKASPGAWFINMSNPMAILLAALEDVPGIRCFGLCELPALTLEKALALVGAGPEEVDVDFLGLNHQGWFVHLERKGRDLLPDVFDKTGDPEASAFFKVDPAVMKALHALPLPYMRLYYHTAREVEKLRTKSSSRGEELSDLSAELYDWYEKSPDADLPDLIKGRGLVWFRLALVPAVTALLGGGERLLYVSELNGEDIPGLPAGAIVEKKCILGPKGTRMLPFHGPSPVSGGPLEPFLEFLRKIVRFEEAALEAALDPRPERISAALRLHPLKIDARTAEALIPLVLKSVEPAGKSLEEEGEPS